MTPHLESAALTLKAGWAFVPAGVFHGAVRCFGGFAAADRELAEIDREIAEPGSKRAEMTRER